MRSDGGWVFAQGVLSALAQNFKAKILTLEPVLRQAWPECLEDPWRASGKKTGAKVETGDLFHVHFHPAKL